MRRSNITALTAIALTLACALWPSASAIHAQTARTPAELRSLLDGVWYLATPEPTARATIDSGIERAVSEMNYLVQGVARDQMRANTPLNRRIDIHFPSATDITVVFDQRFTYTTREGVAQHFDLPDSSSVEVRQYFRDGHFEQYFEATLGRRWSAYSLSPDGQTMTVSATQQGPMMPVPMHFTLDYRQRR